MVTLSGSVGHLNLVIIRNPGLRQFVQEKIDDSVLSKNVRLQNLLIIKISSSLAN